MEIVFVTDRWQADGGGRERYLADLAGWASERGHAARLICRSVRPKLGEPRPERLDEFSGPSVLAEPRLARSLRELRRRHSNLAILALRPQAEATHYQLHSGLYSQAYAAERASIRSAVRRALFWPALRLNAARMRHLAAEQAILARDSTTRLMAFTHGLADHLRTRHGAADARIRVCSPGVDHCLFCPLGDSELGALNAPDRELRLLFVGHDFALKGLASAVAALALVRRERLNARLMVVGRGKAAPFRRLAARMGVAKFVVFAGALPRRTLVAEYQRSHVLVHPTLYDPFSLVVMEALASGCAVVTTRACGASELMVNGRDGYVVAESRDVQALVRALIELSEGRRLAHMRDAGIELARGFPFERHAAEVFAWLEGASEEDQ